MPSARRQSHGSQAFLGEIGAGLALLAGGGAEGTDRRWREPQQHGLASDGPAAGTGPVGIAHEEDA